MSEHPVDEIDQAEFDYAAGYAAISLAKLGSAFVVMEPGDGTSYKIALIRRTAMGVDGPEIIERGLWMASTFGALYPVNLEVRYHWDYVDSHFLDKPHEWTARVLARFLNTLADKMKEQ